MRMVRWLLLSGGALLAMPAAGQLGLPTPNLPKIGLPDLPVLDPLGNIVGTVGSSAAQLLQQRTERIDRLLRRHADIIELDAHGEPARRAELLLIDPSPSSIAAVVNAGFGTGEHEQLEGLGLTVVRLTLPRGMSVAEGETLLGRQVPAAEIAADNLYFQAEAAPPSLSRTSPSPAMSISSVIGVIDGGPVQTVAKLRGFARGAPLASHHGSAVVSLLETAGARNLWVADIYGSDPAGGSALALVRALNWMVVDGVKVISISLGGPNHVAVGKAIASAQAKGVIIVAAVGNDGPAAPPAFPASYPGVIAVTAVDGRGRALIEAGRALHLDYAAPGADVIARNKAGRWVRVRGTSYSVPLVAARAAAAVDSGESWRVALDREAVDIGRPGPDPQFGRGLLCRHCARR